MKYLSVFAILSVMLLTVSPASADSRNFDDEVRNEVVGLFGTLLTPSIFLPASYESLGILLYGRTLTSEGSVPDFDGTFESNIDEMSIFAGARLGPLGLTLGFGQGNEFQFSEPVIVSLDFKSCILEKTAVLDAALDLQYSMIILPEEEKIKVSALGFGVVSVNGLFSLNLLSLLEPYAGLTLNYIYLNSQEEFIGIVKVIPKLGLKVKIFPKVTIGTEAEFIKNKHLDSAVIWDIGASIRF